MVYVYIGVGHLVMLTVYVSDVTITGMSINKLKYRYSSEVLPQGKYHDVVAIARATYVDAWERD